LRSQWFIAFKNSSQENKEQKKESYKTQIDTLRAEIAIYNRQKFVHKLACLKEIVTLLNTKQILDSITLEIDFEDLEDLKKIWEYDTELCYDSDNGFVPESSKRYIELFLKWLDVVKHCMDFCSEKQKLFGFLDSMHTKAKQQIEKCCEYKKDLKDKHTKHVNLLYEYAKKVLTLLTCDCNDKDNQNNENQKDNKCQIIEEIKGVQRNLEEYGSTITFSAIDNATTPTNTS
jgi:hypothetical protein